MEESLMNKLTCTLSEHNSIKNMLDEAKFRTSLGIKERNRDVENELIKNMSMTSINAMDVADLDLDQPDIKIDKK